MTRNEWYEQILRKECKTDAQFEAIRDIHNVIFESEINTIGNERIDDGECDAASELEECTAQMECEAAQMECGDNCQMECGDNCQMECGDNCQTECGDPSQFECGDNPQLEAETGENGFDMDTIEREAKINGVSPDKYIEALKMFYKV